MLLIMLFHQVLQFDGKVLVYVLTPQSKYQFRYIKVILAWLGIHTDTKVALVGTY